MTVKGVEKKFFSFSQAAFKTVPLGQNEGFTLSDKAT